MRFQGVCVRICRFLGKHAHSQAHEHTSSIHAPAIHATATQNKSHKCKNHNLPVDGRADEISKASGMAELSLLTSETLAYLHALSGDFSKEASYRAQV